MKIMLCYFVLSSRLQHIKQGFDSDRLSGNPLYPPFSLIVVVQSTMEGFHPQGQHFTPREAHKDTVFLFARQQLLPSHMQALLGLMAWLFHADNSFTTLQSKQPFTRGLAASSSHRSRLFFVLTLQSMQPSFQTLLCPHAIVNVALSQQHAVHAGCCDGGLTALVLHAANQLNRSGLYVQQFHAYTLLLSSTLQLTD